MLEEIQEKLEEIYESLEIEVKYSSIKRYLIKLSIKCSEKNIVKRSVLFEYFWNDKWTFSANIEQIKYTINKYFKLYLEREVNHENN